MYKEIKLVIRSAAAYNLNDEEIWMSAICKQRMTI